MRLFFVRFAEIVIYYLALPLLLIGSFLSRFFRNTSAPRLVWGSTPIINFSYWSRSMKHKFATETFTYTFYSTINSRSDWDRILSEEYKGIPSPLKPLVAFLASLFRYDIFFMSFDGFMIGHSPIWQFQTLLFRIAGIKTVILPYGSDAYVYRSIRANLLATALMESYPEKARLQDFLAKRVSHFVKHADVMIPGVMSFDGIGRWDALLPSILTLDLDTWTFPDREYSDHDGVSGAVLVTHYFNHSGFKGSEFIQQAVGNLQNQGYKVELRLISGLPNAEVRRELAKADILFEQCLIDGYALSAIEGMALGLPVISNLNRPGFHIPMSTHSFLSECPIASAGPENLETVLLELVRNPGLRRALGQSGRRFVTKYHSFEAAYRLFNTVIQDLVNGSSNLRSLYHPLNSREVSQEKIDFPRHLSFRRDEF